MSTALEAAGAFDRHATRGGKMVGVGLPGARRGGASRSAVTGALTILKGLGMNREAMLATAMERRLGLAALQDSDNISVPCSTT